MAATTFAEVLRSRAGFAEPEPGAADVAAALSADPVTPRDFLALLSPAAAPRLEELAERANALTRAHFGNAIVLFTPIYVSNFCRNACAYCSFARQQRIPRRRLEVPEIVAEARAIAATGMRHILLLTGEDSRRAGTDYLCAAIAALRQTFSSIAIEVYPMSGADYARVVAAGADALTVYQETYDREVYARLHPSGPKADYDWRLAAPERGCAAGVRQVTVGALLGLADPVAEAFKTGLHADWLQRRFPGVELGVSFPRLRPLVSDFAPDFEVTDRQLVQFLCAFRMFMPMAAITMTTRENARFRDAVLPLGVTKMSAGVSTAVGGHQDPGSAPQFEIDDARGVAEVQAALLALGYQPVMHDWHHQLVER